MQYRNPRLVNKLRKLPKKLAKQKRIQECLKETGDIPYGIDVILDYPRFPTFDYVYEGKYIE